ncbi:MAG: alpha-glucosidase [Alphaproteobacteria bacterium]|nr:alpha-glucosidase [Alphaproteobacteria bacterium]
MTDQKDWWRGAVIYQIYPRSFKDANGDGIGDLKGVRENLEYIAQLGVDAIWISPFFKSPMKDGGYDVADYRAVDPVFGDLDDFDGLLAKARDLGLKVVIDQVLSHTSDEHPWFQESRKDRTNQKADWYVWADPKPDGSPPNNWQSVFGGPAWEFDQRRQQYYLHNFVTGQPDLNYHNPDVQNAILDEVEFWLKRGVDGFRLDVINFILHNQDLTDNPPNPGVNPADRRPFTMQLHIHNQSQPGVINFIRRLRALTNRYDSKMLVGEVADDDGVRLSALYTSGNDLLHTSYNFSMLGGDRPSASLVRSSLETFAAQPGGGWPTWAFSNHDVRRVASRWHPDKDGFHHDPRLSQMLIALLLSLRGTISLYQGEELGLPEAIIPFEYIQDPQGKAIYPLPGRDGARSPMPWYDETNGGFTQSSPWLPVDLKHHDLAVSRQKSASDSTLAFTRQMLAFRKKHRFLRTGSIAFHGSGDDNLLMFSRGERENEQTMLCVFNMANGARRIALPTRSAEATPPFSSERFGTLVREEDRIYADLPAYGVIFVPG